MIKVIRGNPTPEELAAALAVVRARAAGAADVADSFGPPPPRQEWSAPARIARTRVPRPGPRAWAHSYWPV